MKICEAIEKIKNYYRGIWQGKVIDPETTRDKILWGDPGRELTGIVTTCFATADVIKEAARLGANLIICHESMFWSHGGSNEWLAENRAFREKTALLDAGGIVVWRNHDYIHSGIPLPEGGWTDGIFFGLMKELGWEDYLVGSRTDPMRYELPQTTVRGLAAELMEKLPINGIRILGDLDSPVRNVMVPLHLFGFNDNAVIAQMEQEKIDTLIAMEIVDFTVAEYVRDSTMTGNPKTVLSVGHFNVEEPGMAYMLQYLPDALGVAVPAYFIPSTDMYNYLVKQQTSGSRDTSASEVQ